MQQQSDQQGGVVVTAPGQMVGDEGGDASAVGQNTVVLPGVPLAIPIPQVHMPVQQSYIPSYSFQDPSRPIQYSTPAYMPTATYHGYDPNQHNSNPTQPQYHPVQAQSYAYHPAGTHHAQQSAGAESDPALQAQSVGDYAQGPDSPTGTASATPNATRRGRGISEHGPMFKQTVQKSTLWSLDRTRNYTLRIYPKIDRGFFLADNDWTCYRRNYFQVSATFTAVDVHGQRVELPCYVEVEDRLRTVTGFLINCVAKTHNGNKEIELVQHTAKRDKGPQSQPQARLCEPMDPTVRHEDSFHSVTFERLQFKSATANNGKRRAAQQYHVLLVELYVRCDDGNQFKVASAESAPLVVRGRAPGHYAAMSSKQAAQQAGIHTGDVLGPGAYDHVVHYDAAGQQVAHHTPQAHYSTYQTQQHPDSSAHYYQPMHQQPQQTVTHYYQTQAYDSNLWAQQGHQATQFDPQTGAPQDHTLHYAQQQLTAGAYQPTPQMVDGNGHPIDANGNPIDSQQSQFDQSHYAHPVYQPATDENGAQVLAVEEQHDIQGVIQDAINGAVGGVEEQELQEELESPETAAPPGESLKSAKKRGRPKKVPGEEGAEANGSDLPPKKKRGRPRKEAAEEEPAEEEQSI